MGLFVACGIGIPATSADLNLDLVTPGDGSLSSQAAETGTRIGGARRYGKNALHWVAFDGNEAMVRELIISGADVNDRVAKGGTPLHLAAYNGHARVVRLLIEHGASVNARTDAGITPLEWAQRNGHMEVVELLIANGARVDRKQLADMAMSSPRESGPENPGGGPQRRPKPLKYSQLHVPESAFSVPEDLQKNSGQPDRPTQAGAFRIQLGAFSSEQQAEKAWSEYRRQHPEVLGARELTLERVGSKGKTLYRAQTGPLNGPDAGALCEQLKQAHQPCIVVGPGS